MMQMYASMRCEINTFQLETYDFQIISTVNVQRIGNPLLNERHIALKTLRLTIKRFFFLNHDSWDFCRMC